MAITRNGGLKYGITKSPAAGTVKLVLMRDLKWFRKSKSEGKRYVNPGFEIPRLILKARGVWPFPAVSGLINAPTLRPDGSYSRKVTTTRQAYCC